MASISRRPLARVQRPEHELTIFGEKLGIGGKVTQVEEMAVVDEQLADLLEVLESPQAALLAESGLGHDPSRLDPSDRV